MNGRGPSLPMLPPDRDRPVGSSPFGSASVSIVLALGYLVVLLVWLVAGGRLPGGRWFAVHLFTLGVLTNLVLTFSEHFSRTVTRTLGERAAWWPWVTNLGIVLVLVGLPGRQRWLLAAGASLVTAVVLAAYVRLRRMRRRAVGARFAWIVRVYERAHGAFVHGAILGALMGVGTLTGAWYGSVRIAHLHANVSGWGGLTLLATLVFFGPTMARTRIEPGADERAARALRHGATGLSVAVLLLVLVALDGWAGVGARAGAALGLAVYAWAATRVCLPVARAAWHARPTASRPLVVAVCVLLPAAAWLDAAVVGAGAWRWLDALGVAVLTGVLAQAMLATLVHLAPMLRGRSTTARERLRARLEVGARSRAAVFNLGVLACVLGASRVATTGPWLATGWVLLGSVVLTTLAAASWPTRSLRAASWAAR